MVLISQPPSGIDPILFLENLLEGFVKDEKGNDVPLGTVFPKSINKLPRVIINQKTEEMKFISIPAIRRRWTTPFTLECWALSVAQRYAIKQSLMARLDTLTGNPGVQLADNYIYMWFKIHEPKDQPSRFGQPIFTIGFEITLVYDTLTGSVPP
jgi:hypothetical protein